MNLGALRRNLLTRPIFTWAKTVLPSISETERAALEAGDVWWDAELFTGNPDWKKLLATPRPTLTDEEQAFMDGPVAELCAMLDDWKINWELGDLPPEVWAFLKKTKFFGMIVPKSHGGLGFSPYAHSEVVRTISTYSVVGAVTVMVPNSLGPSELLHSFGTEEQQEYWLPRLADGREIPAFGLTSPAAGSDAAAMTDTGVVCMGQHEGGDVLGIRLNWHKRYITLGPVATVLGLAFKLSDPERLLGGEEDLGITLALVPTHYKGVKIGRRHVPSLNMFQNGPNWGEDVFIPLDHVIGGVERVGQGWKMLMIALAAGRGISLPSLSAAGAAFTARTTGAYARVRRQFGIPISSFEGIEERLASLAGNAYLLDAGRRLTCAGLNQGMKLAVISGIMKYHATERLRISVNDAMDIHAGKAVIDGPSNYLGSLYRAVPVGITVEGANILTRNLIIFGQGAIRCHPYLLEEMTALENPNPEDALAAFDKAFWKHVGHSLATFGRALARSWTGGLTAPAPNAGDAAKHFRALGRYAAAFALTSDLALLTLGGALKRKEMLSARLGDILSELFLLSAALKRWHDESRRDEDLALLDYLFAVGAQTIEDRFADVFANLPNRWAGWLLKAVVRPKRRKVTDDLIRRAAAFLTAPSEARDRLTPNVNRGRGEDSVATLEKAFRMTVQTEETRRTLRKAGIEDIDKAVADGVIAKAEGEKLKEADALTAKVIAVDDFSKEELRRARV